MDNKVYFEIVSKIYSYIAQDIPPRDIIEIITNEFIDTIINNNIIIGHMDDVAQMSLDDHFKYFITADNEQIHAMLPGDITIHQWIY